MNLPELSNQGKLVGPSDSHFAELSLCLESVLQTCYPLSLLCNGQGQCAHIAPQASNNFVVGSFHYLPRVHSNNAGHQHYQLSTFHEPPSPFFHLFSFANCGHLFGNIVMPSDQTETMNHLLV
jgi:hypothetical protein